MAVGAGLTGQVESWRKWSPADSLVECNDDLAWVDVHRSVIKRRFWVGGDECISAADAALLTEGGFDVVIAAVTFEGVEAWTFAFAAFGPTASRRDAIVSASQALFAGKAAPEFGFLSSRARGYQDRLVYVASSRRTSRTASRPQVLPNGRSCRARGADASKPGRSEARSDSDENGRGSGPSASLRHPSLTPASTLHPCESGSSAHTA